MSNDLDNLLGDLVENRQFDLKITDAIKQAKDELIDSKNKIFEYESTIKQHNVEIALLTQKLSTVEDENNKLKEYQKTVEEQETKNKNSEMELFKKQTILDSNKKRNREIFSLIEKMIIDDGD